MKIILASGSPRRFDLLKQMGWDVDVRSSSFAEVETAKEANANLTQLRKVFSGNNHTSEAGASRKILPGGRETFSEKDLVLLSQFCNADLVCAYNALGKGKAALAATAKENNNAIARDNKLPATEENVLCAEGKNISSAKEGMLLAPLVSADTIVVLDDMILGKPADAKDAKRMLRLLSGRAHQVKTATAVFYRMKTILQVITTHVHFRPLDEKEIDWYVNTGEPLDKAGAYGIQGKGTFLVERIEGNYDNVVGLPVTTVYEVLQKLEAL